jgi:parallel beta-helix repeat protein
MHFLNNEIFNTGGEGEGFYLGGNNNSAQFFNGIIERNYIHHLNGPTVTQGDGIELKDGSYNNIVRDNVIHDTKYPGILVYGVEEQGGPNIIERNVIWNSGDHAIQAAADAIIRNNIIFSSAGNGIHSQNHQGAIPGNLTIENNTVRTSGNAIHVVSPTSGAYSGPIEIANNALYPAGSFAISLPSTANTNIAGNVGTKFATSGLVSSQFNNSGNLLTDFENFAAFNAFPASGSKLIGAGVASLQPSDDFNLNSRSGSADVGAYIYDVNGNPGWPIGPNFKQFLKSGLPGDFNGDDIVNGSDFLVWQRNPSVGELADWRAHFGKSAGNAAAMSVPEPNACILLAAALLATIGRRGRFPSCRRGTEAFSAEGTT